jgi:hypothetical protein
MFVDPESGMCKLNAAGSLNSYVRYDQMSDQVRFSFPVGNSLRMNRHATWWRSSPELLQDIYHSWFFQSPQMQCMDETHAFGRLDLSTDDGSGNQAPQNQFSRPEFFVWGDADGYIYEFDPRTSRAGLALGQVASGISNEVGNGESTSALVWSGGAFYTGGDGLAGLRLEVRHPDGSVDIRKIASNTNSTIVPVGPFSQAPVEAEFWIAGIPMHWLSWLDHGGAPVDMKKLTHLYFGFNQADLNEDVVGDFAIGHGYTVPSGPSRTGTFPLTRNEWKKAVYRIGRFFRWSLSNTYPDQRFMISYIDRDFKPIARRRRR